MRRGSFSQLLREFILLLAVTAFFSSTVLQTKLHAYAAGGTNATVACLPGGDADNPLKSPAADHHDCAQCLACQPMALAEPAPGLLEALMGNGSSAPFALVAVTGAARASLPFATGPPSFA